MVLEDIGEFRSELGIFGNFGLEKSCAMEATKTLYELNYLDIWKYLCIYVSFRDTQNLSKLKMSV